MHSRIFQLSKSPIDKDDYIDESKYYDHWFTSRMDYVDDDTDRDDDIEWLSSCYGNSILEFGEDDDGKFFVVKDKVLYFADKAITVQIAAEKLATARAEQLATPELDMVVYGLKKAYNNQYGFYMDVDDCLQTFDEFIRGSSNGDKYYIGATVDYHF